MVLVNAPKFHFLEVLIFIEIISHQPSLTYSKLMMSGF